MARCTRGGRVDGVVAVVHERIKHFGRRLTRDTNARDDGEDDRRLDTLGDEWMRLAKHR